MLCAASNCVCYHSTARNNELDRGRCINASTEGMRVRMRETRFNVYCVYLRSFVEVCYNDAFIPIHLTRSHLAVFVVAVVKSTENAFQLKSYDVFYRHFLRLCIRFVCVFIAVSSSSSCRHRQFGAMARDAGTANRYKISGAT